MNSLNLFLGGGGRQGLIFEDKPPTRKGAGGGLFSEEYGTCTVCIDIGAILLYPLHFFAAHILPNGHQFTIRILP